MLAYAGLRPGELRALCWGDVRERTILVQRGADCDGKAKTTKTRSVRTVRLLAPLTADLRHSFASLLLAEGRTVHYVAAQLGHSPVLTLSTYGHLIAEYAEAAQIDAEREIILPRDGRPGEALVRKQARHIG